MLARMWRWASGNAPRLRGSAVRLRAGRLSVRFTGLSVSRALYVWPATTGRRKKAGFGGTRRGTSAALRLPLYTSAYRRVNRAGPRTVCRRATSSLLRQKARQTERGPRSRPDFDERASLGQAEVLIVWGAGPRSPRRRRPLRFRAPARPSKTFRQSGLKHRRPKPLVPSH